MSWFDCNREAKALKQQDDFSWLKEVNSQSLNSSLKNLHRAFVNFFEGRSRFPRFKSRRSQQSFHCPQHCEVKGNRLLIPKFRGGIRIRLHRPLEGVIKNVTIKKTVFGAYYTCIQVEVEKIPQPAKTGKSVGLDLGLHHLITTMMESRSHIRGRCGVLENSYRKHAGI